MPRIAFLLLLSANLCALSADLRAADAAVDIDTAAQVYQAAAVREQVRASLGAMPARLRQMFAADAVAKFSEQQLAAVASAAERGFRIDVFEPPALGALAANMDPSSVKRTLAFLSGDLGRRMVAADLALTRLGEADTDKVMGGQLTAASTPRRDALLQKLEQAARTTESTVQIYLGISRAIAIGTAIGAGMDPIAADERARKSNEAGRPDMEDAMREPLRRYLAYGYRDLSDADLKQLLAFLGSAAGKHYVTAYIASISAGYDAMGRRCGEQIGESFREIAQNQPAAPIAGPLPPPDSSPALPPPSAPSAH